VPCLERAQRDLPRAARSAAMSAHLIVTVARARNCAAVIGGLCDPDAVRLLSGDGASVDVLPVAYQFNRTSTAAVGTDWDANWLMIRDRYSYR
jgi:hypothetical protein